MRRKRKESSVWKKGGREGDVKKTGEEQQNEGEGEEGGSRRGREGRVYEKKIVNEIIPCFC